MRNMGGTLVVQLPPAPPAPHLKPFIIKGMIMTKSQRKKWFFGVLDGAAKHGIGQHFAAAFDEIITKDPRWVSQLREELQCLDQLAHRKLDAEKVMREAQWRSLNKKSDVW